MQFSYRQSRPSNLSLLALLAAAASIIATASSCSNSSTDSTDSTTGGSGSGVGGATGSGASDPGSGGANAGGQTASGGSATGGGVGAGGSGSPAGGAPLGGGGDAGDSGGGSGVGGDAQGSGGAPIVTECDPSSAPEITKLGLEMVAQSDDLTVFVHAAQPPGSDDWYLVDALGYVRVFSGGVVQATPFLDLSAEVQNSTFSGTGAPSGGTQNYDERGLLSIAFPPDYQSSGKFYVTLIPTSGADANHDLVLEFQRSVADPLTAEVSTRKAIVDLEPSAAQGGAGVNLDNYHNGSTVLFGPDGMLYVGMGDGGGECNSASERVGAPQDVASPYGKILRLDPNGEAPLYAAAGNPFATDGDPRVLHYGLRNPFRFSFDEATGDLFIGEVGQWTYDWITFAEAGETGMNFGWPSYEGPEETPIAQCNSTVEMRAGSTRKDPIFNLSHGAQGGSSNLLTAIVGGTVYRGTTVSQLSGAYLFGEFYPNRPMRALYQCGDQTSAITEIQKRCDPNQPNQPCFTPVGGAPELVQVGAIVQGHDGEIYLAANGNALLKVVPAPE